MSFTKRNQFINGKSTVKKLTILPKAVIQDGE